MLSFETGKLYFCILHPRGAIWLSVLLFTCLNLWRENFILHSFPLFVGKVKGGLRWWGTFANYSADWRRKEAVVRPEGKNNKVRWRRRRLNLSSFLQNAVQTWSTCKSSRPPHLMGFL